MRLSYVNDGVVSGVAVGWMDVRVSVGSCGRAGMAVRVGSKKGVETAAGINVEMDACVEIEAGMSIGAGSPHDDRNKITRLRMVQ
jgi:hypothetical protein